MLKDRKVSIIMPAYNAGRYIKEAIQSVFGQNYSNWELLIINDGSKDNTEAIILSFEDKRLRYFAQDNKGVSAARNLGLVNMQGDYFCFLDADDALPKNSISSRLKLFDKNKKISFVDGHVQLMDSNMRKEIRYWKPNYRGAPLKDLLFQTGKSFFGQTWMIKRISGRTYRFHERLTHGEDLLFLMELVKEGGEYAYVNELILRYRNTPNSAMKDLAGLEYGYRYIGNELKNWPELKYYEWTVYNYRWRRAMFLSHLRKNDFIKAIKTIF